MYDITLCDENSIYFSNPEDLYKFEVYVGNHTINLQDGDSAWLYNKKNTGLYAETFREKQSVISNICCTVIRGYSPPQRTVQILNTNLPYINGCSTESILPPIRMGDPTMQLLYMPVNSSEQEEHIHSTSRVVTILNGSGVCVSDKKETQLKPNDVLILDKMVPHHFYTEDNYLLCSPLHIWSSVGPMEQNHPMFNGTHLT